MKKLPELDTKEMLLLGKLLERANQNEQLSIGMDSEFMTQDIVGVSDHGDQLEIQIQPSGLKWLWVRYAGAMGGKKKATNAKKRKAR